MRLPKIPHLTRQPLARQISLAVLVKIAILAILWAILTADFFYCAHHHLRRD
jgi:hypothetical protein